MIDCPKYGKVVYLSCLDCDDPPVACIVTRRVNDLKEYSKAKVARSCIVCGESTSGEHEYVCDACKEAILSMRRGLNDNR